MALKAQNQCRMTSKPGDDQNPPVVIARQAEHQPGRAAAGEQRRRWSFRDSTRAPAHARSRSKTAQTNY